MQISQEEREVLYTMQEHDLAARALQRTFEALPQRQALLDIRAKKRVLAQKIEKIDAALSQAKTKDARLKAEDEAQAAKQTKVQEEIEAVRSDFRSVEARTKELAGISKRRDALRADLDESAQALKKIASVKSQADAAMAQLDKSEKDQTDGFIKRGTELKNGIARSRALYERAAQGVSSDLRAKFERVLEHTQGVVLSELQGDTCAVCRSRINEGKLVAMHGEGNASVCPYCGRLLFL